MRLKTINEDIDELEDDDDVDFDTLEEFSGSLDLGDYPFLEHLKDMTVRGGLDTLGADSLQTITNVTIQNDANIAHSPNLTKLDIRIRRSMLIQSCPKISDVTIEQYNLPSAGQPTFFEYFHFLNLPNLKTVKTTSPLILDEFSVESCMNFNTLPSMTVNDLRIVESPNIHEIPENVKVMENLAIKGSTKLNIVSLIGRPGLKVLNYYPNPTRKWESVEIIRNLHNAVVEGKMRRGQAKMLLQDKLIDMGLGHLASTKRVS